MDLAEFDQRLRQLVASSPPPARAEMLRVLTIHDDAETGEGDQRSPRHGIVAAMAELLIDAEEDPYLRTLLVGSCGSVGDLKRAGACVTEPDA